MMSIQNEIDKLKITMGEASPVITELIRQFSELSESELINLKISSNTLDLLPPIKTDTEAIRNHLGIVGNISINFDFIRTERVRSQLIKDNVKMENIRLNILIENETDRFHDFCSEAFYQIEELVNYYFGTKYSFKDFILKLKSVNPKRAYNQVRLSEINISDKIFLFESIFYHKSDSNGKRIFHESIINLIRDVRNQSSHRCNVIERDEDNIEIEYKTMLNRIREYIRTGSNFNTPYPKTDEEKVIEKNGKLLQFIKEKNYNLVRDTIKDITLKIASDLNQA